MTGPIACVEWWQLNPRRSRSSQAGCGFGDAGLGGDDDNGGNASSKNDNQATKNDHQGATGVGYIRG
jgi:hypothetical protein